MDRIEIYTSRKKSLLILICSIGFVALGVWLLMEADHLTGWRARNPVFTRGIGIASVLFFGFGIVVGLTRVVKPEIALIIDAEGVNVNPKKSLTEFIRWDQVLGFEEIKIQGTRIIVIKVKDPGFWLGRETSVIRRKLMQLNINNYNSPFNIAAAGLDISHEELNGKLNSYFHKYKK